jgi:tetratricopeptide (TPR) repeat protein
MKKETLFFAAVFLIIGVLIGVLVSGKRGQINARSETPIAQAPTAPLVNYEQSIRSLKELLAKEPNNRRAWVQLGNAYFDSNQFLESIEAYDKALALDPNDPNVLTDQGVMYRNLGWFDKAIENFRKANTVDPNHAQSVFNMWVVYRQDLNDLDGAKKAIQRYLEIAPNGPASAQLRADLAAMNGQAELPPGHPPIPGSGQPLPGGQ